MFDIKQEVEEEIIKLKVPAQWVDLLRDFALEHIGNELEILATLLGEGLDPISEFDSREKFFVHAQKRANAINTQQRLLREFAHWVSEQVNVGGHNDQESVNRTEDAKAALRKFSEKIDQVADIVELKKRAAKKKFG